MELTKEEIKKLLEFIDAKARKVCELEYGLPLYDDKEELLIYQTKEFLEEIKEVKEDE